MKTLFFNGTIITMHNPLICEALMIEDDKILDIGKEDDLRNKYSNFEEFDLDGKTLLPGFIDPHSHFSQVANSFMQISLNDISDINLMRQKIQEYIKNNNIKPNEWIQARDYDNNIMIDGKNPSLEELDTFCPQNPIVIHHKSGHMGLMNSMALNFLGIDVNTKSFDGGKIEVENGKLTGYLEENAFFTYLKKIPMPSMEQFLKAFENAQNKYASYGITTIQDGMFVNEMFPLYQMMLDKNILYLDLVAYPDINTIDKAIENFEIQNKYPHLKIGGVKAFLDGSPQGRTAWMRTPYIDNEKYFGYGTISDDSLIEIMQSTAKMNRQLICHCNGDAASEQFLRCLEQICEKYPNIKNLRNVIIHGQLIGIDQLDRVKKLGAIISFFIAHVYYWGDVHIKNFGFERASKISPLNSANNAGIIFTLHQDSPVIEPNMLETLWCSMARITKDGIHLGEDEELTIIEALKAITINGAYQYFEEKIKGSLEIGKIADLVILNKNPLTTPKEDIKNIKVLETFKNGKSIFKK